MVYTHFFTPGNHVAWQIGGGVFLPGAVYRSQWWCWWECFRTNLGLYPTLGKLLTRRNPVISIPAEAQPSAGIFLSIVIPSKALVLSVAKELSRSICLFPFCPSRFSPPVLPDPPPPVILDACPRRLSPTFCNRGSSQRKDPGFFLCLLFSAPRHPGSKPGTCLMPLIPLSYPHHLLLSSPT